MLTKTNILNIIAIILIIFISSCSSNPEEIDPVEEISEDFEEIEITINEAKFEKMEGTMEGLMHDDSSSTFTITHEYKTIKLNNAVSVDVLILVAHNNLNINSGTEDLMDASFVYQKAGFKPEVEYKIENQVGYLTIKQKKKCNKKISIDTEKNNNWDIVLNKKIPLDLKIKCISGFCDLKLGNLNLKSLKMKMSTGENIIDFRGDIKSNSKVYLSGEIEISKLYLPNNIGVKVIFKKDNIVIKNTGLIKKTPNLYVNKLYKSSTTKLEIEIYSDIGLIELISDNN